MRQYSHAARLTNELCRLRDLDLRLGYIAAFSRKQVFVKCVAHGIGISRFNQSPRDMRTGNDTPRQLHHAIQ